MDVNLEKEMGLVEAVLFLDSEPLTVESIRKMLLNSALTD